ncbi:MAG TPA: hypothetical protein VL021_04725 [Brumimicrobium sp.]|nr:hypothetical protein [Brumimicrobium sp.]
MKKTIYIFTFLVLLSCGESNSKQKTTEQPITSITNNTKKSLKKKDDTLKFEARKELGGEESSYNPEKYRRESLNMSFKNATLFSLADTIIADFNGDGIKDKAVYVKENETSGIIIFHGKTNEEVRIGFGKSFAHLTEFDWIDYWGLVKDRETSETIFEDNGNGDVIGSKDVMLQNPSIFLGADEQGGGLITFINGKYEWIHQTC